ncbi:MAG: hypothetical protein ABI767_00925 [Rhodanobacter sp.]
MNDTANDQDVIRKSYEAAVDQLFTIFYGVYTLALTNNDNAARTHAEDAFRVGISHARLSRDRAIALLP